VGINNKIHPVLLRNKAALLFFAAPLHVIEVDSCIAPFSRLEGESYRHLNFCDASSYQHYSNCMGLNGFFSVY
jgi:hypothetical protein